jgi:hypothetical protein
VVQRSNVLSQRSQKSLLLGYVRGRNPRRSSGRGVALNVGFEKQENGYAGYRNVKPDRKSDAGEASMHDNASAEGEEEGGEHYRQGHDREHDVAGQNGQIERPHPAVSGENSVAVQGVIRDVAHQEKC